MKTGILTLAVGAMSLGLCGTAAAQIVNDSSATAWAYAIDTEGGIDDPGFLSGNPSVMPFVFDLQAEIAEPLSSPIDPNFHRSSLMGQAEMSSDVWFALGSASVEYPEPLDPAVNYGDQGLISGSVALFFQTVEFSITSPTIATLDAFFRTDQVEPFNPSLLDGFRVSIETDDGTDILQTDFDHLLSGQDQSFADSVVLAPGEYVFRSFAQLAALETLGYRSASSGFEYTLTFVPTPASGVVLAIGSVLAVRRRRY